MTIFRESWYEVLITTVYILINFLSYYKLNF